MGAQAAREALARSSNDSIVKPAEVSEDLRMKYESERDARRAVKSSEFFACRDRQRREKREPHQQEFSMVKEQEKTPVSPDPHDNHSRSRGARS